MNTFSQHYGHWWLAAIMVVIASPATYSQRAGWK